MARLVSCLFWAARHAEDMSEATYEDMLRAHAQVARAKARVRVSQDGLSVQAKLCRLCCAPRPKFRCACGTAYYCDATCQRADWRRAEAPHKHECTHNKLLISQDLGDVASWMNTRVRPVELTNMWFQMVKDDSVETEYRPLCADAASFLGWSTLVYMRCGDTKYTRHEVFAGRTMTILRNATMMSDDDWAEWGRAHVTQKDIATTMVLITNVVDAFDGMAVALLHPQAGVFLLHYRHAALARGLARMFTMKCVQGRKRGFKRMYAGMWERIHGGRHGDGRIAANLMRYRS